MSFHIPSWTKPAASSRRWTPTRSSAWPPVWRAVRDNGGRLFLLGVGGSAGHAGHAVNDFRKLCGFEAYAPTDNVSELTARINDEGWETCFANWLLASRCNAKDCLLIFSVGGGSKEKNISVNLVRSIQLAKEVGAKVFGIVGRDGGFTAQAADACVVVPPLFPERITPHTEGLCAVVWHLLVSHPALKMAATKWESAEVTVSTPIATAKCVVTCLRRALLRRGANFNVRALPHRRRRRVHRQPFPRPAAGLHKTRPASRSTTTSPPAGRGTSPTTSRIRGSRSSMADIHDFASLKTAMAGHDTVIHLASNPDIARAVTEPDIDFREGTQLTERVVEAMRQTGTKTILYASGSGVYGELGEVEAKEDHGPMMPVSTYGASKLAGEALIASYAYMFDLRGRAFRFGNVVGRRQTHGVGFDFVRRLLKDPTHLRILGDGKQSKSYVHVADVVGAVLLAHARCTRPFEAFNVATGDYITVTEIADLACECVGLDRKTVQLRIHRRRPRLEGRRAGDSPEHRQDSWPRLAADAHLARGPAAGDAGHARRHPLRPRSGRRGDTVRLGPHKRMR